MFNRTALLGAVIITCVGPVWAQSDSDAEATMDTVIIEGSRLNQSITEIGTAVSLITADDIEELVFDFAVDVVASAPGVTINQNGGFGGSASVRIRGASSAQTLVLVDGIPVNDPTSPGGGFNFARVDTENIERIEVLRGPQSTLWGTDAIGGVVSIKTKTPADGFGGSAYAEYGSYNTMRGGASIEHGTDQGDFRLAFTGMSSDGISKADENNGNAEDDGYEAYTVTAKGGLNFAQDARLAAEILWSDAETEFDSFVCGNQGNVGDGDEVNQFEELSANVSLTGSLFDGRLENLLIAGYGDLTRENFTNGTQSFDASGDRAIYRYQGTLNINDANTFAFGAEREETTSGDNDTSIDGLFALYGLNATEHLTLTAGLRVDDHKTFGSETTGRLAIAYNPTDKLTLRASWGQGFKAPTIFQVTGGGFALANPNLQPETSESIEAGIDWRGLNGRFETSVTVFDADIEDLISYAASGYFNEAEVETRGIEVSSRYDLNAWASVELSYTYLDATDTDGAPLRRIPEHSGDIRFTLDPEGPLSGAVLIRYNDVEPDSGGRKAEDWTRVDLTGAYALSDKIELFGRIENLFDEEYQQILGYGTPDLSGSIGVRVRY